MAHSRSFFGAARGKCAWKLEAGEASPEVAILSGRWVNHPFKTMLKIPLTFG